MASKSFNGRLDSEIFFASRVAGIPEIRDMICEFVDAYEEYSCPTLTSLLRTNRDFFFSAVRLLWGTRTIAEYLLTLLPGVSMEYTGKYGWKIVSDLPDSISEDFFDRFRLYGHYVKHLEFSLIEYRHTRPRNFNAIRSYAHTRVLFPNLVSLSASSPMHLAKISIDGILDWLGVFMSPTLQQLDLSAVSDISIVCPSSVFYAPIIASLNACPNLTKLSFSYCPLPAAADIHATVPLNLTSLRCRFARFDPETLAWLAGIPKLQRLEFYMPEEPRPTDAGFSIDGLASSAKAQSLTLEEHSFAITMLLYQTPLVNNLTRLDMCLDSWNGWNDHAINQFFVQLVKSCTMLSELALNGSELLIAQSSLIHYIRILQPLPLRELSLSDCREELLGEPKVFREILDLWPTLHKLDLGQYTVGLDGLGEILTFCPHLLFLRLYIEMSIPDELSDEELARALVSQSRNSYTTLKIFSSYASGPRLLSLSELDQVSRYLLSLRPHISYSISSSHCEPWMPQRCEWAEYLNAQLHASPNIQPGRKNEWESFQGVLG